MRVKLAVGINTPSAPGCDGRPRRFDVGEVVELPDALVAEFAAMRPPVVELDDAGQVKVYLGPAGVATLTEDGTGFKVTNKPRRAAKQEEEG